MNGASALWRAVALALLLWGLLSSGIVVAFWWWGRCTLPRIRRALILAEDALRLSASSPDPGGRQRPPAAGVLPPAKEPSHAPTQR